MRSRWQKSWLVGLGLSHGLPHMTLVVGGILNTIKQTPYPLICRARMFLFQCFMTLWTFQKHHRLTGIMADQKEYIQCHNESQNRATIYGIVMNQSFIHDCVSGAYSRCSKISNTSHIPKRSRQTVQTQSSLISVFPICYSDEHFVNSSLYNPHFRSEN